MGISEYRATGGNRALLNDYHRKKDSAAVWYVNFKPYPKQEYSFDYLASSDHGIFATDEYYPKSGNYDFRYKSVATSTTDRVIVDFDFYPEKDSVIFKDKYGVKLKLSKDNVLTFTATSTADTNYIYAYRGEQRIGKLVVKTYAKKKYQICLVSVNGAKLPNQEKLKKYLDEIYHQANVEFEISVENLTVENLFPFSHGDKNRFSGYNDDQKRVLEAFDSRIKENINYLFFIPDGAETNGVAGYNPLGYNFGFIYHGAGMRTIAHELAHGIGSLKHPFSDSQISGKTNNLMDYYKEDGLILWHFQWDMLQNPPKRIFKWRFEESEAEMWDFSDNNTDEFNKIVYDYLIKLCKCPSFKFIYELLWGIEKKTILVKHISHNDNLYKDNYKTTRGFWDANTSSLCLFYDKGNNYNFNISTIVEEFYHAAHYHFLKNKKTENLAKKFMTQTEIEVELFKSFVMYYINMHKQDISLIVNSTEFDPFSLSADSEVINSFKYICNLLPWQKTGIIICINSKKSDKCLDDFYDKTMCLMNKTHYIYQSKLYGSYKSMDLNKFDSFLPFLFNCLLR